MTRHAHLLLRLCLLSLMLTPPLAVAVRHPVAEGKTWVGLMLVTPALWAGLAFAAGRDGAWRRARRSLAPLLLVHVAIGLSLLHAIDLPTALNRWGELAAWSALIPLAAMLAVERRWPARLVGIVAIAVSLAALQTIVAAGGVAWFARIEGGAFGNRNQLGQFLALGAFPLAAWTLKRRAAIPRVAGLVMAIALLTALLITRSKAAWLALMLAVPLALTIGAPLRIPRPRIASSQRIWLWVFLAVTLVGGGAIAFTLSVRHADQVAHEIDTLSVGSQSIGVRLGLWERSLGLLRSNPVTGCGVGQWPLAVAPLIGEEHFRLESTRPREAHCDWLQWAAETGAVGILALLGFLLWALIAARDALRGAAPFLWPGALALLALSMLLLVAFPIQRAVPPIVAGVWLGTLVGSCPPRGSSRGLSRPIAALAALALAASTALALPVLSRQLVRDHHLGAVRAALAERVPLGVPDVLTSVEQSWALGSSPLWGDLLGLVAIEAGRPELAQRILSEASERDPGWFEHWRLLSLAQRDLGESEAALDSAERAAALAPSLASVWMTLQRAAWEAGDRALALEALDRALEIDPDTPQALRERALLLQEMRRFREAAEAAVSHLAVESDDALLWQVLGLSLNKLDRPTESLAALQRAVELDETLVNAWHILATIHIHRWEGAEAERCARRALALDESDPLLWDVLAYALSLQSRTEEAHRALDQALRLDPSCAPAWRTRGLVLNQEERFREGAEALVQSWRLNPADPLTQQILREMGVDLPDQAEE